MPGNPRQQAFAAFMREHPEVEEEIFDLMSKGWPVNRIAARFGASRRMLYHWRDWEEGRAERWAAAMEASGEAHVENARRLLQKAVKLGGAATAPHVSAVNSLANFEKWLAGVKNPSRYGEKAQAAVNVNVNLGALHLDALRQANQQALPAAPKQIEGEVVDAEIVDAESEGGS